MDEPGFKTLLGSFVLLCIGHPSPRLCHSINAFPSTTATFRSPSDGINSTRTLTECICCTTSWRGGHGRRDCVFIKKDPSQDAPSGLQSFEIAQLQLFFSFEHGGIVYPCALVHMLEVVGNAPDKDTGMWIVKRQRLPDAQIIPLNFIYRAAHLLPVFQGKTVLKKALPAEALDTYRFYYVNKFVDRHASETAC